LLSALILSACRSSGNTASVPRLDPTGGRSVKIPSGSTLPTRTVAGSPAEKLLTTAGTVPMAGGFSAAQAMVHVRALADRIGVRRAGSAEESRAAQYVFEELVRLGYEPRFESVPLTQGTTTRNVVASKRGRTPWVVVLGAHLDSKSPSPGANDAASGVGALLAMASVLAHQQTDATVQLVFFGAEEIVGADRSAHHFGSRYRVAQMTASEKAQTAGMLSLDMISFGDRLHARTMGKGPRTLADELIRFAKTQGVTMTYLRDPGSTGQSDHEPFELAGIPVVWVQTQKDPLYHTPGDTGEHIQVKRLQQVGQLVYDYVRTRTERDLESLRR
jgi:aminopeptidase YwaD